MRVTKSCSPCGWTKLRPHCLERALFYSLLWLLWLGLEPGVQGAVTVPPSGLVFYDTTQLGTGSTSIIPEDSNTSKPWTQTVPPGISAVVIYGHGADVPLDYLLFAFDDSTFVDITDIGNNPTNPSSIIPGAPSSTGGVGAAVSSGISGGSAAVGSGISCGSAGISSGIIGGSATVGSGISGTDAVAPPCYGSTGATVGAVGGSDPNAVSDASDSGIFVGPLLDDEPPTNDDSGSGTVSGDALPAAPSPPLLPPDPSSLFSLLAWTRIASQLEEFGPAMYLKSGHTLTFRTLAHYLNDTHLPLGAMDRNTLRDLAPSLLVRVEAGATLVMENVTLLLSCADLDTLLRGLCSSTAGWPESPGVALRGGDVLISSLDTVAPGPDGRRGGGGAVQWREVNMTCARTPTQGAGPPYCTAGTVRDAAELHSLLGQPTAGGPTIASLAANTTLPRDGGWAPPNASAPDAQLLLLGRAGLTSVLDLAERQRVWVSSAPGTEAAAPVVNLYDVTLVNLPYAASPSSAGGLLALELPSFVVERRATVLIPQSPSHLVRTDLAARLPSSPSPSGTALLSLVNCTLVLPDPEFAFLAGAVQRNASDLVQYTYGVPAEGGGVAATDALRIWLEASQAPPPVAESAPDAAPAAPPPPLKLDLLEMWPRGPIAVRVAPGFEEALAVQSVGCGDPPLRARVTAIPPAAAASSPSGSLAAAAAVPAPIVVGAAADGGGDDGGSCTVAGFPAELSPEGARTFVDLRAASSRAHLGRSLVLRDLVLYNLAPGGWGWSWGPADGPVNATASTGASTAPPPGALAPLPDGPLQGADAAWANSSLPLWYFGLPSRAPTAVTPASTAPPLPLLRLDNVTLVVPEAEWRALAAAVLTQHAAAAASQPARSGGAARLLLQGPAAVAADDATARGALMRFAAASVPLSYDPAAGALVLAEAAHYGWTGVNVTLTCRLPLDAPPGASMLPYPQFDLPYEDLAATAPPLAA
ncbi:hypothetical protein GPECTOR_10g969 [Gonium pectorale]|uniref:Uncharacterized protein n=1 Tax=Gonium pectorale TaxID=33097 RepID=A0A150GRA1_GONPE|nr:hypothetical protein GPECTOR_10g969 [Gonium pectorale]|eukprot:KXZ52337.1 hypothetical protein GPECTOR_10g969 [Gonium pectorale]